MKQFLLTIVALLALSVLSNEKPSQILDPKSGEKSNRIESAKALMSCKEKGVKQNQKTKERGCKNHKKTLR